MFTSNPIFVGTIGMIIGVFIGALVGRLGYQYELRLAERKQRQKYEDHKKRIADSLGAELFKVRSGLFQTLEAFEATLRVVDEELPASEEIKTLLAENTQQREIGYDQNEQPGESTERTESRSLAQAIEVIREERPPEEPSLTEGSSEMRTPNIA